MATTIVFDLITQLVRTFTAQAPAGVQVFDGQGATDDPGNFIMVGVGDPDSDDLAESASGTQEWKGIGKKGATEEGTVVCCALAWSGESGSAAQQAVREDVRDMVAGIDAALKADPNLGGTVPGLNWVRYGKNWALPQGQVADAGSECRFYFEIFFTASI